MISNFNAHRLQWMAWMFCLALSYISFLVVQNIAQGKTLESFEVLVDQGTASLKQRADDLSRTLDGVSGFILAANPVSAESMSEYVRALHINTNTSEIDAIGFASFDATDTITSNADETTDGNRSTVNALQSEPRVDQFSVQYIEPYSDNKMFLEVAFGNNPEFLANAKAARDTGQTLATEIFFRGPPNGGHLQTFLLKPIYRSARTSGQENQLQTGFLGFAFAVLNVENIFRDLTISQGNLIDLRVEFDQKDSESERGNSGMTLGSAPTLATYVIHHQVKKFGQPMSLSWSSRPEFEAIQPFRAKWIVLALGLLITALISLILNVLVQRNLTVTALVEKKSRELDTQGVEKRSILENAMLAIVSVTQSGEIIHANDASVKLLSPHNRGTTLNGKSIRDFLPDIGLTGPDGWAKLNIAMGFSDAERLTIEVEKKTWITADGETRITLLIRDITVNERLAREIVETEQRWNLALTGAQIGVFDVDLKCKTSVVSETWLKCLQIAVQSDCEDPYRQQLDHIHPDDRQILEDAEAACIKGVTDRAEARFRIKIANGEWRWIKSDAVIVERATDGTALRMLGIQTDITESFKLEQMKRDFVSTVSHELRTPLTSINGALSLLRAQTKDTNARGSDRLLQIGISNCDRLVRLVNDILDIEKINAGKMTHDAKAEDIHHILSLASAQVETYASQWHVAIDVVAPESAQSIWTDKNRIMQVLTNLLSNACKFAHSGTTVRLGAEILPGFTKISVRNLGPGIPEEFKDMIFQPFSQADNSTTRERGGTGLGLNISRHLVEAMGGTMGFESEPDKETIFWFTCPLYANSPISEKAT
ncbi:ATP-binding protein [Pseudorhodobacter sp. W20_MBD10_FR17]|uniref:ATP-binding protein n=1 Tax=Pseudorhodobacter sp. W20_MBD10_FR17 TaxID=3240266 RepID=UPI003F9E5D36